MGFYLRKSVRVGAFRFNLSKGGVGVSVGIKGLRVGSGPRGNYVHMGAGGVYYRATIPARQAPPAAKPPAPSQPQPSNLPKAWQTQSATVGPMVDIDSAQATTIVDSSSQSLLEELNTKRRRWLLWPWALGAAGLALLLLAGNDSPRWLLLSSAVVCAIGVALVAAKDQLRKSAVVLYDLDSSMEEALNRLYEGANVLASASAAWHVSSSARVHDSKYHAGAGHVIARSATRFTYSPPPFVRTNVRTVSVNVGAQTLHFFPDRVLIYDKDGVGAVSYPELRVDVSATNFVEEGGVPRDATVTGHTWRYVNKKGGPDRRFKDNRQIPVCRYEEVALWSQTGLNELLQISRLGSANGFAHAISRLASIVPR